MHRSLIPLALCSPLFAGACVLAETTEGTGLEPEPLRELVVGASTRADVTRLLGPPDEIVYSNLEHDPLFERAFRYKRTKTKQTALFLLIFSAFQSETRFDHAIVFFDDQGLVEHVGYALDRDQAEHGLGI